MVLAARRDPSAFVPFCFSDADGQRLQQAAVHRDLQDFLSGHRRALIELPRDHGKSLQICGRILWELGHAPHLRIKLVCATDALAEQRGQFLRRAIEDNSRVKLVFPHLAPASPWSAEAFTIARPVDSIGPSVAAFGIGSGTTGARADLLVCDDVVDVRSLYSRGDRERAKDVVRNNLLNLLEPDGRFWGLFTPWHPDDLNAELKANPAFALFRRAVGPNLEPVWPEKWNDARLAERRAAIGEAAFARGYRLIPVHEGELVIHPEWVRFWNDPRSEYDAAVLSVDPAVGTRPSADASALVVLARPAQSQELRVLEARPWRVSAPDLVERIAEADRRWEPDVILFESNAAFAGLRDLMQRHARFGPKVRGVVQTRSKWSRAAALSVPVQTGVVRLQGGPGGVDAGQRELYEEMTTFPFAPHDDLLDALAMAVEYLLGQQTPRIWV